MPRWVYLLALGGPLVAAVAGFALVGWCARRHHGFDWELASIFGTAVGTTLLALSTLALALWTWREVRVSDVIAKQAVTANKMTRRELERRPRLNLWRRGRANEPDTQIESENVINVRLNVSNDKGMRAAQGPACCSTAVFDRMAA